MLNGEKFKKEIEDVDYDLAKCKGKIVNCCTTNCKACDFYNKERDCNVIIVKWLLEEYKEPLNETAIELVLNLIEPFEIGDVKYIIVKECDNCYSLEIVLNCCYIKLYYECGSDIANLFKELELDKKYTPKELGLC